MTATVPEWSTTAASNTTVAGIDIAENCAAANINNAIRAAMAATKGAVLAVATSGTDTYTATLAPAPVAYTSGMAVLLRFGNANTAADPTINLNSLGAKTIKNRAGAALPAGAVSGDHWLVYDGTNMRLVSSGYVDPMTTRGDIIYRNSSNVTARLAVGATAGHVLKSDGTDAAWGGQSEVIVVAVSDETTAITTGTAKVTFRMPFAMTLTSARAALSTASSSGNPAIDVNEGGASIFSTTLTIDANEKTSTTAATPAVISDSSLADDAEMTVDIDTAGTGAKGLKVYLIGRRT